MIIKLILILITGEITFNHSFSVVAGRGGAHFDYLTSFFIGLQLIIISYYRLICQLSSFGLKKKKCSKNQSKMIKYKLRFLVLS